MIAPRSTEVGAWKENVARKATQRVKPTSAILIKKYPRQRQDGVYTTQRKRLRLLGYQYGPINPASHRRGQLQHLGCAWPCGGGTEGRPRTCTIARLSGACSRKPDEETNRAG
jgi:hypothetical protein